MLIRSEQRHGGFRDILDRSRCELVAQRNVDELIECGGDGFESLDVGDGFRQERVLRYDQR